MNYERSLMRYEIGVEIHKHKCYKHEELKPVQKTGPLLVIMKDKINLSRGL